MGGYAGVRDIDNLWNHSNHFVDNLWNYTVSARHIPKQQMCCQSLDQHTGKQVERNMA